MTFREAAVEAACSQRDRAKPLLLMLSVMAALLGFSLLYLDPGTTAHSIALVDLGLLVVAFGMYGGTFWYCTRREMDA